MRLIHARVRNNSSYLKGDFFHNHGPDHDISGFASLQTVLTEWIQLIKRNKTFTSAILPLIHPRVRNNRSYLKGELFLNHGSDHFSYFQFHYIKKTYLNEWRHLIEGTKTFKKSSEVHKCNKCTEFWLAISETWSSIAQISAFSFPVFIISLLFFSAQHFFNSSFCTLLIKVTLRFVNGMPWVSILYSLWNAVEKLSCKCVCVQFSLRGLF